MCNEEQIHHMERDVEFYISQDGNPSCKIGCAVVLHWMTFYRYITTIYPMDAHVQVKNYIYGFTAWIAAASLFTLPEVIPATDILPSLVA
jgi:hypothetical protein